MFSAARRCPTARRRRRTLLRVGSRSRARIAAGRDPSARV